MSMFPELNQATMIQANNACAFHWATLWKGRAHAWGQQSKQ